MPKILVTNRPLVIVGREITALRPHPTNPRIHKPKQIRQVADSIARFGFTAPILIDSERRILAGHGRLAAAKLLGLSTVPTICLAGLSEAEKRAYIIADNKLSDNSSFDPKMLASEVRLILEADPVFDLELTGFDADELDLMIDIGNGNTPKEIAVAPPQRDKPALSRTGDLWVLGEHRLVCGDALAAESYSTLMPGERARIVFCDPPYNVRTADVVGKGRVRHPDFKQAAGEMSEQEFTSFLTRVLQHKARMSVSGSLHFVCMDWRHEHELLSAGKAVYDDIVNICVWTKPQPGMGSLYRSQHEFVTVFKKGQRAHLNNVRLGKYGRNRSNIWSYSSGASFSAERQAELAGHPTPKPVALVEDALLDASDRGDIVLDGFGGSGTTLIAADRCDRRARLIEIDPYYCDVIIRRFEAATGSKAVCDDGATFADRQAAVETSQSEDAKRG